MRVLLTLPIQAAAILTVASVVAWVAWVKTTYAYPVRTQVEKPITISATTIAVTRSRRCRG